MNRGWRNESVRHSLAAKGVKTSYLKAKRVKRSPTEQKLRKTVSKFRQEAKRVQAMKTDSMPAEERATLEEIRLAFAKQRDMAKADLAAYKASAPASKNDSSGSGFIPASTMSADDVDALVLENATDVTYADDGDAQLDAFVDSSADAVEDNTSMPVDAGFKRELKKRALDAQIETLAFNTKHIGGFEKRMANEKRDRLKKKRADLE